MTFSASTLLRKPHRASGTNIKLSRGLPQLSLTFGCPAPVEPISDIESLFAVNAAPALSTDAEQKFLEAGDIIGVLAGTVEGIQSSDNWWLFCITRDVYETAPNSKVFGQWLEYELTDDDGNQLYRKSDHTNSDIKVNSFLKDSSNSPFVLLNEYYKESLDTVCINPEACHVLDEILLSSHIHPIYSLFQNLL